jgi:hypothetical protein
MRWMNDETRARLKTRHEFGSWTGYVGLFLGLMTLLATTSEGTPFAADEKAWVVLVFMLAGYTFGWAIGPMIDRMLNPQ